MRNKLPPTAPAKIYAYFDKIQFWLPHSLDSQSRSYLREQCRKPRGFHTESGRPASFDIQLRERIEVRGISDAGLRSLAFLDRPFFNRIEISIDYIFGNCRDRDATFEFFHHHLVRRHHGRKQEVRCYRDHDGKPLREYEIVIAETQYDAARYAPHSLAFYKDDCCRVTGEIAPVLHLEWRASGAKSVRNLGIHAAVDLSRFNHHEFWARRLMLRDISTKRLGRLYRNLRNGTRSRRSALDDGRIGEVLRRSCGTVQLLLDKHGRRYPIRRVLEKIPNDRWLPKRQNTSSVIYPDETTIRCNLR